MKKFFIFSLIFVTFIPIPLPWVDGSYNKASGLYWCSSQFSCYHEIGHKLDDEAKWISHSPEFYEAVIALTSYEVKRGFLNKNMEEIYAELFASSGGVSENMPELLRPFYNWERASELIDELER